nr:capsid protein [Cressdnaviricota sp.]
MYRKRVYRKRAPRKLIRRKRAVGKRRSSVSATVKKYVKSQIHKNVENKVMNVAVAGAFGNILQSPTMNVFPMTPYTGYLVISQGVTANARLGNQVTTRRVMLNYCLVPKPYDATTNPLCRPQEVDMFLGYVKATPSTLPNATDFNNLFQVGSTSLGPQGELPDLIADINKDYWHISKRWRHKVGYADVTGTGAAAGSQYYANNDFKFNVVRKLNITKYCPKTLLFNDSANTPTSRGLFFFYQCVSATGAVQPVTTLALDIDYWLTYEYEDA